MDITYLKRIVKIFEESALYKLEISEDAVTIKLVKGSPNSMHIQPHPLPLPTMHLPVPQPALHAQPEVQSSAKPQSDEAAAEVFHEIPSPIVGTFYRAPSPEADSFVKVGSHVSQGSVLCIIEAMKLMNEIESDISGTIMKILVDNGKPVEYGQPLFLVKPDA